MYEGDTHATHITVHIIDETDGRSGPSNSTLYEPLSTAAPGVYHAGAGIEYFRGGMACNRFYSLYLHNPPTFIHLICIIIANYSSSGYIKLHHFTALTH